MVDKGIGVEDPIRNARIQQLREKYQSGKLEVDASALASKLVDSHLSAQEKAQGAAAESKEN